jgi:hypothetical protein
MVIERHTIMVTAPVEPAGATTRHYLGRRVTGLWRPGWPGRAE